MDEYNWSQECSNKELDKHNERTFEHTTIAAQRKQRLSQKECPHWLKTNAMVIDVDKQKSKWNVVKTAYEQTNKLKWKDQRSKYMKNECLKMQIHDGTMS